MRAFLFGIVVGIAVLLVLEVGALVAIGHTLAVSDPLEKADVIVAISGDEGPRTETAVALWRRGYAPYVLFSGASLDPDSVSSAELMKREAVRLGVPANAVLVEPSATSTEENATFVAQTMGRRGLRSAILVTSPYHQRRASILFSRAFTPAGLSFRNHPADDPGWSADRWWLEPDARRLTLIELVKLAAVVARG